MNSIIKENFSIELYGFAGVAVNRNWSATGMALTNKLWQEIKSASLRHKGINIWVYGEQDKMFAGVELLVPPEPGTILECKKIHLQKYVYCKHTGAYDKIKETGSRVQQELDQKGIRAGLPYLEIYGHWTDDVSKLETELLWCLA